MRPEVAGQIRMIQGRADFDQVHAHQLRAAHRAQKLERLAGVP